VICLDTRSIESSLFQPAEKQTSLSRQSFEIQSLIKKLIFYFINSQAIATRNNTPTMKLGMVSQLELYPQQIYSFALIIFEFVTNFSLLFIVAVTCDQQEH
jgi:hypothetical protein